MVDKGESDGLPFSTLDPRPKRTESTPASRAIAGCALKTGGPCSPDYRPLTGQPG